jgi:hypothetical protein
MSQARAVRGFALVLIELITAICAKHFHDSFLKRNFSLTA